LAVCLFTSASRLHFSVSVGQARRGGRKGGSGGIPPAEPIARKISSDFFKYTPRSLIITIKNRYNYDKIKTIIT